MAAAAASWPRRLSSGVIVEQRDHEGEQHRDPEAGNHHRSELVDERVMNYAGHVSGNEENALSDSSDRSPRAR